MRSRRREAKHVPILYPRAGMRVAHRRRLDAALHRSVASRSSTGRNAINSNSIAFMLEYGRFRMLFTGDAGSESEERFLARGRRPALPTCSKSATMARLTARRRSSSRRSRRATRSSRSGVTISSGTRRRRRSRRLQRFGAQIYRTDEDGAVTVVTDGTHIAVSTMLTSAASNGVAGGGHLDRQLDLVGVGLAVDGRRPHVQWSKAQVHDRNQGAALERASSTRPPITTMPSGRSACEPGIERERQRQHAGDHRDRRHDDRPESRVCALA